VSKLRHPISFLGVLAFIVSCGFFQGISGVVNSNRRAESVSQLLVQHLNDSRECRVQVSDPTDGNGTPSSSGVVPHFVERITDAGQLQGDDTDNIPGIERNERSARDPLYRWALEINHIDLNIRLDGDILLPNSLCSPYWNGDQIGGRNDGRETKFGGYMPIFNGDCAEWIADDSCIRTDNDIFIGSKWNKWKLILPIDFQNCVVLSAGIEGHWYYNSREFTSSTWKANQDCGEKFSAFRIGNNVTRSENEAVLSNEKSCPSTFSSSFNANYSARESFTCLALAKRRLSYLCVRTDERYNKNNHETGDFQLIPPMQVVPLIPIDDRSILPPLRE